MGPAKSTSFRMYVSAKWTSQARWKLLGHLFLRLCPAKKVITTEELATVVVEVMALLVEVEKEAVVGLMGKVAPSTLVDLGLASIWKVSQWKTLSWPLGQAESLYGDGGGGGGVIVNGKVPGGSELFV